MLTAARTIKVYDLESQTTSLKLKRESGNSTSLYSLTPFGNNIISAGDDDGGIFVWDTRSPDRVIFQSHDCEQYISDIDGIYETRRLLICTSGEGTLTAYDLRAMKMIEPQSELFDTGFQCLKLLSANKKIVVGAEDGAVYIFNQNEWGNTSGKHAITDDARNRGKCSIDCLEVVEDDSVFLAGCSDGKLRAFSLWPYNLLTEGLFCKRRSLESIHKHPNKDTLIVCGENYMNFIDYTIGQEDSDEGEPPEAEISQGDQPTASDPSHGQKRCGASSDEQNLAKKAATNQEDYLNLFS